MANQYSGSFEHIIQQKFNCSAEEALKRCVSEGLSYTEAEEKLGFKHGTIRKWANRFDLKLKAGEPPKLKKDQFMKFFKESRLNRYNILSRSWLSGRSNYSFT
jgi:transposase